MTENNGETPEDDPFKEMVEAAQEAVQEYYRKIAAGEEVILRDWSELFPDGREIFYEGDDPAGFVEAIKAEFGFDPSADPGWGEFIEGQEGTPEGARILEVLEEREERGESVEYTSDILDIIPMESHTSYGFFCPPEHLDAIYSSDRWPMGS